MNDTDLTPPDSIAEDFAPAGTRKEFRGIGEIHKRKPIAAVVEVLRRKPVGGDKWEFVRPFTGIPDGSQYAWHIMQAVPTATNSRGAPCREPHPAFAAFNTCHPEKARMLRARIVNWSERDTYQNFLGAWGPPAGHQAPPKGFWCRGDGVRAERWINGKTTGIPCPNKLCEFSAEGSGPRGQGCHCKPHLELVAQFNWPEGNPLPKVVFQWDSQSWNNAANIEGMFGQIKDLASRLGYENSSFPVLNLCFTMHLKERVKAKKRFPEVGFSIDEDIMKWMQGNHMLAQNDQSKAHVQLEAPRPLGALPPPGYSEDDMRNASEATLSHYNPKNVRDA